MDNKRPGSILQFVFLAFGGLLLALAVLEAGQPVPSYATMGEGTVGALACLAIAGLFSWLSDIVWELRLLRAALGDAASNQPAPTPAEPPRHMD